MIRKKPGESQSNQKKILLCTCILNPKLTMTAKKQRTNGFQNSYFYFIFIFIFFGLSLKELRSSTQLRVVGSSESRDRALSMQGRHELVFLFLNPGVSIGQQLTCTT